MYGIPQMVFTVFKFEFQPTLHALAIDWAARQVTPKESLGKWKIPLDLPWIFHEQITGKRGLHRFVKKPLSNQKKRRPSFTETLQQFMSYCNDCGLSVVAFWSQQLCSHHIHAHITTTKHLWAVVLLFSQNMLVSQSNMIVDITYFDITIYVYRWVDNTW